MFYESVTTAPAIFAIGGAERRHRDGEVLQAFLQRAGGSAARLVVVPSASVEPVVRAAQYRRLFTAMGAARVDAIHPERGVLQPAEHRALAGATGIFVTGGDQVALMAHLQRSGALDPLRAALRGGAVYAGTSAGAAAISRRMIVGSDEDDAATRDYAGLGLLHDVVVDQHFSERGRLPRLIAAVERLGLVGVGVDEDTAMVFEGDTTRVVGAGTVTVVRPGVGGVVVSVLGPFESLEAAV
jgi:cyanophycinase